MRPKLNTEEIAALKKSLEMEYLPDDDSTVQSIIQDTEDHIFNEHSSVEDAKQGDILWMSLPTGALVKCVALDQVETEPPKAYKVQIDGTEETVVASVKNLYKTQRAAMLGNLEKHLLEYIRFAYKLRHSFTGESEERIKDKKGQPAKYKVGDTVWYRESRNSYRYHSGTVTAVAEETDFWDAEFMPYTYHVESKNINTVFHRDLTSDRVFGSRNEVILDIINDRELQLHGDLFWFANLRGTTETEEDVPDDYEAKSI